MNSSKIHTSSLALCRDQLLLRQDVVGTEGMLGEALFLLVVGCCCCEVVCS